jgi:hypothetical protein
LDDEPKGKHGVGSSIVFAISDKSKVTNTNPDGNSIELTMKVHASKLLEASLSGKIDPRTITSVPHEVVYNKKPTTTHGVTTVIYPDWTLYRGVAEFTPDVIEYIRTYMYAQLMTYPKLKVKFNGVQLKSPNVRKLVDGSVVYSYNNELDLIIHTDENAPTVQFTNGLINSPDSQFMKVIQTTFVKTIRDWLSTNASDEVAVFVKPKMITDQFRMILSISKYPNLE